MAKKRSKRGANLGQSGTYEIHFFVPGHGFRAKFYDADSKEKALEALKREFPKANAFWINLTRGKALAGPQTLRYTVWWKLQGADYQPFMVFALDPNGQAIGSVPNFGASNLKWAWELAQRRTGHDGHRLEEVDEPTASLIANEVLIQASRFGDQVLQEWEAGKFDQLDVQPELEGGLRDVPFPDPGPRPEMWDLEQVVQAVRAGHRFGLPFVLGESLFTPNAYWIGGQQYVASLLAMSLEHAPELQILSDGWLRVKLYFQPEMVPQRTWVEGPNPNGVVSVFAEIDPATVDWAVLNRPS